jgi:transcriptional regulator with XRE-family HTH domain
MSAHRLPTDFRGARDTLTATIGALGRHMARQATHFGTRVRAMRLAAGLTQAELAEASGISERTVSDLERGRRSSVYPATARALAAALQVSGDQLSTFLLLARGSEAPETSVTELISPLPAAYRSRLPARPTRLIGRSSELASILALVRDPGVHLVTVLGPGGVGKTRLATEVAAISRDEFTAGSWFADLSVVGDTALVLPAIAASIGLQSGMSEVPALLADRIGAGRSLLVLDTFEHLLPAGPAIAELAAGCSSPARYRFTRGSATGTSPPESSSSSDTPRSPAASQTRQPPRSARRCISRRSSPTPGASPTAWTPSRTSAATTPRRQRHTSPRPPADCANKSRWAPIPPTPSSTATT